MNTNLNNYLCDSSLHDEKVRVVDVQLDGPEEVADAVVLDVRPVDQVFVLAADHNLNKFILFKKACNETISILTFI